MSVGPGPHANLPERRAHGGEVLGLLAPADLVCPQSMLGDIGHGRPSTSLLKEGTHDLCSDARAQFGGAALQQPVIRVVEVCGRHQFYQTVAEIRADGIDARKIEGEDVGGHGRRT